MAPSHRALFPTLCLALSAPAFGDTENDDAEENGPLDLGRVTVEASKRPAAVEDIAASVTVIDAERISREMVQNIDDLVRFEPGIDVVNQGSRFGRAGFNIRGLGGNRVLIEVDGVPTSNAFSIGSFSNASRDFVDVDALKAVEIVRGPSSALFGSNAIGGVVSFVTRDPVDYLFGESSNIQATAAWYGVDRGLQGSATAAAQAGDWSGLLRATYREGEEIQDTGADPLESDSLNVLAKLAWGEVGVGGIKLTVEDFEAENRVDVQSLRRVQDFTGSFGFPYLIDTNSVLADDTRSRSRVGLEQTWRDGLGFTDFLRWRAYWQESETTQDTRESRELLIGDERSNELITRGFLFQQEQLGIELNVGSTFQTGSATHRLAYGLEWETAETSQLRDGALIDPLSGEILGKRIGPDTYPVRDFPASDTDSLGLYLQDAISIGAWTLVPALRWDRFEITPQPDAIFLEDNPGIVPQALDDSELSPKLGILRDFGERWQIFLQYSEGFRAPPVNDVNVGFTNFQFGYTAIPNPDLRSESSWGLEAGMRYQGARANWEITAFHSEYEDFIEALQVVGFDPLNNLLIFQSVNFTEVEIAGMEARGEWSPEAFPDGLSLQFAGSWAEGDNLQSGQPLNSVAPPNGVLGLAFDSPSLTWGGSAQLRGALEQDRVDESAGPLFVPDTYVLLDLTAYWKPSQNTRLRAGLFNVTDEDWWSWLDVAGLPADSPNVERLRRPGRNFSVAFDWSFR